MRDRPPHCGLCPLPFMNSVWLFQHPKKFICARVVRQGLQSIVLVREESVAVSRCHYKGSTFSSVGLRPWVSVRLRFEPAASRLVDRHLSDELTGRWSYPTIGDKISLDTLPSPNSFMQCCATVRATCMDKMKHPQKAVCLNGGEGGGVWIFLSSKVTPFEDNVSTILWLIVALTLNQMSSVNISPCSYTNIGHLWELMVPVIRSYLIPGLCYSVV